MKILVLEDGMQDFALLQGHLESLPGNYEIIGPAGTVASARTLLRKDSYDLIIADIRLADGLVFEALDDSPAKCPVIFTTGYGEYAVKAFGYNGTGYLLKPVDRQELAKAIDKAVRQHSSEKEGSLHYRHRFLVAERDGYLAIGVEMISYIHSEGGLTRLFLKDKRRFVVEQSLDELEKQLDPSAFFRANRQHIVHITSVKRLSNWFNRKTKVIIAEYPDKEIIISKEKTPGLKHWMDS